jgi:hypothetical protein
MIPTKETSETWKTGKTAADNTAEKEKTGTDNTPEPTATPWEKITTEKTPEPVTIYTLYENFAECYVEKSLTRPIEREYVPGTLKKWDKQYYYIPARKSRKCQQRCEEDNQMAYYNFCKKLFIKGQSQTGSLERALQQTQAAAALPTR